MTIYVYVCQNCNHRFENRQSIKSDPLTSCPKCSKDELIREIQVPTIRFKGGGFYCSNRCRNRYGDDDGVDDSEY